MRGLSVKKRLKLKKKVHVFLFGKPACGQKNAHNNDDDGGDVWKKLPSLRCKKCMRLPQAH
jgi:hypothetical protein